MKRSEWMEGLLIAEKHVKDMGIKSVVSTTTEVSIGV